MVNIAESMGNILEVHMFNYARFKEDKTAELYKLRNKGKVAAKELVYRKKEKILS